MYSLILVDFTMTFMRLWPTIEQEIAYHKLQPEIYDPEQFMDYIVAESLSQILKCRVYDHHTRSDFCKIIFGNHSRMFMQLMRNFIDDQNLGFLQGSTIKIMITRRELVIARYS